MQDELANNATSAPEASTKRDFESGMVPLILSRSRQPSRWLASEIDQWIGFQIESAPS